MSKRVWKVQKARQSDRIPAHEARALQIEANNVLRRVCRATTNLKDEEVRTAFINVQTLEVYPWKFWAGYHTLMTSYPQYWESYAVVRVDGWEGVVTKHYDLIPHRVDKDGKRWKEKYLLSTINQELDESGQVLLDSERQDKLQGYGTIVYAGPYEVPEEVRDAIVERCRAFGMTMLDIELAKALGGQ